MDQEIKTGLVIGQKLIKFLKRDKGYYLDFDGVIKPKHDQEQGIVNFPWIFHKNAGKTKCPLWLTLHFGCFNTISQYCIESCWKLYIRPYDVATLFTINDYLETRSFESKAGLDMRTYTFGMYRAFCYFQDKKSAKTLEHTIKTTFDNSNFEIFTKRGCTEYENKLPSTKWKVGDNQSAFEGLLKQRVEQGHVIDERIKIPHFDQPPWLQHIIKFYWAQSAYASGDPTWKQTPYAEYVQTSKTPVKY